MNRSLQSLGAISARDCMGMGIYPSFKPTIVDAQFQVDGKALFREYEVLDEIALSSGLLAFSSFADNREVPEDFEGDPDEMKELLGPWDEWFDPTDALKVVEGLINMIRGDKTVAAKLEDPDYVQKELIELKRCLQIGVTKGVLFRLEVA